ncbi:MAG: glycosyltransferase family 9 protein [Chitinophagales bacterium]|nr:glycosyltransferase family 9 protein [Chitinophagales bacterium]
MKYRLIYFLEKKVGKILCFLLSLFANNKKSSNTEAKTSKLVFIKFIEQGAWVLHLPNILYTQKRLGKENVYLCTFDSNRKFIQTLDFINDSQVFYIQNKNLIQFATSFLSQAFIIRKNKVKTSVDLEFLSYSSIFFSVISGVQNRLAFIDENIDDRNKLITHSVLYSNTIHVSETSTLLIEQFFTVEKLDREKLWEQYKYDFKNSLYNQKIIDSTNLKIIIHPNFIDPLPLRSWSLENYADLIQLIQKSYKSICIILTGRKDERAKSEEFITKYRLKDITNLCGETNWEELFQLYKESNLLICSDSGPAHFASLLDLNTVVMFGPENPVLYKPLGKNVEVVYKNLSCSPCFNVYNQRISTCTNNICMQQISVSEVMNKVVLLLEKNSSKA